MTFLFVCGALFAWFLFCFFLWEFAWVWFMNSYCIWAWMGDFWEESYSLWFIILAIFLFFCQNESHIVFLCWLFVLFMQCSFFAIIAYENDSLWFMIWSLFWDFVLGMFKSLFHFILGSSLCSQITPIAIIAYSFLAYFLWGF